MDSKYKNLRHIEVLRLKNEAWMSVRSAMRAFVMSNKDDLDILMAHANITSSTTENPKKNILGRLKEKIVELEKSVLIAEQKDWEDIAKSMSEFRAWKMTADEFKERRKAMTAEIDIIRALLESSKKRFKRFIIDSNNSKIPAWFLEKGLIDIRSDRDLEMLLWEDIQNWWRNAMWVFMIRNMPNLIAIRKWEWSYEHLWDMPYMYSKLANKPNFPRILKTLRNWKWMYIVMEKAIWRQLDEISKEEIAEIPQKHFDELISNIRILNSNWLQIDTSKPSNFFYDSKIWFSFIDLWQWNNNDYSHYHKDITEGIFSKYKAGPELKNAQDEINRKVKEAMIQNWLGTYLIK